MWESVEIPSMVPTSLTVSRSSWQTKTLKVKTHNQHYLLWNKSFFKKSCVFWKQVKIHKQISKLRYVTLKQCGLSLTVDVKWVTVQVNHLTLLSTDWYMWIWRTSSSDTSLNEYIYFNKHLLWITNKPKLMCLWKCTYKESMILKFIYRTFQNILSRSCLNKSLLCS